MAEFRCDNGRTYIFPDKHCSSCKHCTDVYYDYINGPYLWICLVGSDYDNGCDKYEKEDFVKK